MYFHIDWSETQDLKDKYQCIEAFEIQELEEKNVEKHLKFEECTRKRKL